MAQVADHIIDILRSRGQDDYIGESISQLQHCLQAAHFAVAAEASDEVVIAALLHDIGQFLPIQEASELSVDIREMRSEGDAAVSVGRVGHETIGESYLLRKGFSARVAGLVGSHVAAKRYLCAIEPAYHDALSEASKQSLVHQGGPMSPAEVQEWSKLAWCEDMCRLRKWDDAAKVPDMAVPPAEAYKDMMVAVLSRP